MYFQNQNCTHQYMQEIFMVSSNLSIFSHTNIVVIVYNEIWKFPFFFSNWTLENSIFLPSSSALHKPSASFSAFAYPFLCLLIITFHCLFLSITLELYNCINVGAIKDLQQEWYFKILSWKLDKPYSMHNLKEFSNIISVKYPELLKLPCNYLFCHSLSVHMWPRTLWIRVH